MNAAADDYTWRRSGRCDSGSCVEVATAMLTVAMRDSEDPDGPVLRFPPAVWREFVEGVKAGDFTLR